MTQLPLSLELPNSADIREFFVSEANQLAYGWLEKWPDWPAPYHSLNIYGPTGCGKTHLGAIFATKLPCHRLTSLRVFAREDYHAYDGFILDGVAHNSQWDEEALFHLLNYLAETGKSAFMTSTSPLSQMPWQLPDLLSRCRAIAAQGVHLPDDALLEALLDKYFSNRQCQVAEPAMRYILSRVERSYEAIAALAQEVDRVSLAQQRPVTLPLMRAIFEQSNQ